VTAATSQTRRGRARPDARATHHAAVLAAELRRIEQQLRAVGPMPRQALARSCGENTWRDGNLTEAVREGIRQHRLRQLPFGWIARER
jgi:hypothetical protein